MTRELAGRRVTVMGLGRFGGGAGVTRWLVDQGARVLLTDRARAEDLAEPLLAVRDLVAAGAVELRLGAHEERDFARADLVVASPAVALPWENRFLGAAAAAGVPITTEIRLLFERLDRARIIGVTGTAGKSTTAAMIHHVLDRAADGRAHLGGNIGGSLLPRLDEIGAGDHVVLELSSFMLHWLGDEPPGSGPGLAPGTAVMTNLAPNHLDWHGSFEHYRRSKEVIFRHQRRGDVRFEPVAGPAAPVPLRIPGPHNQTNALLATRVAAHVAGLDAAAAAAPLADFAGLPHRLALVLEEDGLSFYDDSKATTPDATRLAVAAFSDAGAVHLIAGGYDKGSDLAPIAAVAPRLAGLYTIGATGPSLARLAPRVGADVAECGDLATAVHRALARMEAGSILLLSPGCASWDQFPNYEARGEAFARLVRDAVTGAPATSE